MKVLFRLDSLAGPRTGLGYYTEHLCRELLNVPGVEVTGLFQSRYLTSRQLTQQLDEPETGQKPDGASRLASVARHIPGAYIARRTLQEQRARRSVAWHQHHLYHEPSFLPLTAPIPTVATVHDFSHLRYPQHHPGNRARYLARQLPEALDRVSAIITDSHFVKNEIAELFPAHSAKTTVVELGVEPDFCPCDETASAPVLQRYGLGYKRYILSVATLEPRKNLEGLVRAYRALPQALQREFPLVLAGGRGWKSASIDRLISECATGSIVVTGRVPRNDLPALMTSARLFAYPSFYEGFGLPIAEARACGTPVLTTNYGAMKEVAGDEAFLSAPDDLAENLLHALRHAPETVPPFRYCWQHTAQKTVDVYRQVLDL